MLESEITYAELAVKSIKESEKKNKVDYVHPQNDIKEGFIIINYKKRNIKWKELMDGRLRMMVPEDWKLTESTNNSVYQYEALTEKERMTLIYNGEVVMEDDKAQIKQYIENSRMPLVLLDSMEIPYENGNVLCNFLMDKKNTFFSLFFCRMGEGTLQGIFAMHRYRKKSWKHIIPQMLGTMEMLRNGVEEDSKKQFFTETVV